MSQLALAESPACEPLPDMHQDDASNTCQVTSRCLCSLQAKHAAAADADGLVGPSAQVGNVGQPVLDMQSTAGMLPAQVVMVWICCL